MDHSAKHRILKSLKIAVLDGSSREDREAALEILVALATGRVDSAVLVDGRGAEYKISARDIEIVKGEMDKTPVFQHGKIFAIKKMREVLGCGLREAKETTEHAMAKGLI
tara:strand:- start:460 stop:789 length:330 start_codon:yes stop_codon:yes gene_type:complete